MADYKTEQEKFWAEEFGDDYLARHEDEALVTNNVGFWTPLLTRTTGVKRILELGCNAGLNLRALNRIDSRFDMTGYEINAQTAKRCAEYGVATVKNQSILEPLEEPEQFDLTFTKGVLIHINPDHLTDVYDNLVAHSRRYVAVCEYYNPSPVEISYRGHGGRLFKRDFAGEVMDRHGLRLVDYRFVYRRDPAYPQDDTTWFLMEKPGDYS